MSDITFFMSYDLKWFSKFCQNIKNFNFKLDISKLKGDCDLGAGERGISHQLKTKRHIL